MRKIISLLLAISMVIGLLPINSTYATETIYTLSYDANGGTGTAPNDVNVQPGTQVLVSDSNGLTRDGYFLQDGTHKRMDWAQIISLVI